MKYLFVFSILFLGIAAGSLQAQTTGYFTDDRDGTIYKTVEVGGNVWLAENLKFYPDKDSDGYPGKMFIYNWNQNSFKQYGVLYTWQSAQYACPYGWHLPTLTEWVSLLNYYGSILKPNGEPYGKRELGNIEFVEKEKLYKKTFEAFQYGGRLNFNIKYGGYKDEYVARSDDLVRTPGSFFGMGSVARFWTSSDNFSKRLTKKYQAKGVIFQNWRKTFAITPMRKNSANSVRCVKN